MAANGNSGNGNTGTATSASQAQSQAASANAAASNAANGNGNGGSNSGASTNTSGTTGNTSTGNTSTSSGATNSAGLMGSLMSFGNSITGNVGNTYGGSGSGSSDGNLNAGPADTADKSNTTLAAFRHAIQSEIAGIPARSELPADAVAAGDKAYTEAKAKGLSEEKAQRAAREAVRGELNNSNQMNTFNKLSVYGFQAKNTGPTYNPAVTAQATTNKTIAKGSSEMGPSAPAASVTPSTAPANTAGPAAGSTGTDSASAAPSTSDAANTGITNRGGTVANGGGTAVTDSGTGGSISSSVTPPSRDASSIGLGVYNTDRANYDQDNWNRGMEVESSSLVSDEECKAFAKRAFMENSEPFKKVRVTIIKKC